MNHDKFLALKAKNGDQEALEDLVKIYYQQIYRYFVRKCSDEQLALDLTQEVFIKLTRNIHNYCPLANFSTYLYKIANNIAIDYYRKKKFQYYDDDTILNNIANITEDDISDYSDRVKHILNQLSEKQRECIILYYYQELKYTQIAEILNIPVSTAKTRVKDGLAKCKKLWEVK